MAPEAEGASGRKGMEESMQHWQWQNSYRFKDDPESLDWSILYYITSG
jgi:hypothetical protein